MAKSAIFLLALIMIAATVVNCSRVNNNEQNTQRLKEQAQMQKVLEEHSRTVGMGLTGRLASGYPGPAAASRVFPPVLDHVNGRK